MTGGYQRSPFNFENFGVNFLSFQANGEQIPRLAYQPNFQNNDYIRTYFEVLAAVGFDTGSLCWDIKPENGLTATIFTLLKLPMDRLVPFALLFESAQLA